MRSEMGDHADAKQHALDALHAIPAPQSSRTFNEPWEAEAFAIAVALQRRGVFTWDEWAATLGRQIKEAQAEGDPDTGNTYYHHWLAAIERIVQDKCIASQQTLARYREAWGKAADRTPHGQPIELARDDFA
jgi:nitrile hydratase accessory protein